MLGDYEQKIADMQHIFDKILISISGEFQEKEIHEIEKDLFRSLLKMGLSCLGACVDLNGTEKDIKTDFPYHKMESFTCKRSFK